MFFYNFVILWGNARTDFGDDLQAVLFSFVIIWRLWIVWEDYDHDAQCFLKILVIFGVE